MTVPYLPAQQGLSDVIEGLIQILVLVFFFGLPMLEGVFKKRNGKGKPAPRKGAPAPRGSTKKTDAERTGRDLWKELLEQASGKESSTTAPPRAEPPRAEPPRPTPAPAPRPVLPEARPVGKDVGRSDGWQSVPKTAGAPEPAAARSKPGAKRPKRRPIRESLPSRRRSAPRESLTDWEGLDSGLSPAPSESELERTGPNREPGLEERMESGAGLEGQLEAGKTPVRAKLADLDGGEPVLPAGTTRPQPPLAVGELHEWRRAILAAEVLGAPVALRGTPGPPALDR